MTVVAVGCAERAAQAVRELNHATLDCEASGPLDVYAVLGDLVQLLERLPQAFDQLSTSIRWRAGRGELCADDMVDSPQLAASILLTSLAAAAESVIDVKCDVQTAHQAASHLYLYDVGVDGEP